jgi:hypothetical protein
VSISAKRSHGFRTSCLSSRVLRATKRSLNRHYSADNLPVPFRTSNRGRSNGSKFITRYHETQIVFLHDARAYSSHPNRHSSLQAFLCSPLVASDSGVKVTNRLEFRYPLPAPYTEILGLFDFTSCCAVGPGGQNKSDDSPQLTSHLYTPPLHSPLSSFIFFLSPQ